MKRFWNCSFCELMNGEKDGFGCLYPESPIVDRIRILGLGSQRCVRQG